MSNLEIILLLLVCLSVTWAGIITVYACYVIKKSKAKVAYYQTKETQLKIYDHVLRSRRFQNGGEVFR